MKRRQLLFAVAAAGLLPREAFGQAPAPPAARFADMHSHLMLRQGISGETLRRHGMRVIAEKLIPDGPLIRALGNKLAVFRDAAPGEMRRNFEFQLDRLRSQLAERDVPLMSSVAALDRALQERVPGVALSSEGADFLEGDLAYLETMRAAGLACLQLVHYRVSEVGDIATEEPRHGGLTAFGKDVVRACNRLGILVDVAHCTTAGIEQALEISSKPIVYSHGFVSMEEPRPGQRNARAIHAPLARKLANKGGAVGIWPLGTMFGNREAYAEALLRAAGMLGVNHVGIGSDINGLPNTVLPTHEEFAEVAELLAKKGLKDGEVEAVMGGNYLRVLRQALAST